MKEHALPGSFRKISNRDPRRHSVTMASHATLYRATMSSMADPVNVAEATHEGSHPGPTLKEDSDGEPPLVIDIVNIKPE